MYFGKTFREVAKQYSNWRKLNLMFGSGSYIKNVSTSVQQLESKDCLDKKNHVLEVICTCSLATFELNSLDTSYLRGGIVFPEQHIEPLQVNYFGTTAMFSQPMRIEAEITLRSIDFTREAFEDTI